MFSESVGLILKAHDRRFKFSNLNFFCPVFILLSVFAWVGDPCLLCWLIGTRAEKLLEGVCALVLWRNVLKHLSDNCELSSLWREFVLSHEPVMGLHLRLTGNRHTCSKWECGIDRSPMEGKSHIFNNSSNTYGLFFFFTVYIQWNTSFDNFEQMSSSYASQNRMLSCSCSHSPHSWDLDGSLF